MGVEWDKVLFPGKEGNFFSLGVGVVVNTVDWVLTSQGTLHSLIAKGESILELVNVLYFQNIIDICLTFSFLVKQEVQIYNQ